jgi:hypothetical protein
VGVETKYQGIATVTINHPEIDNTPQKVMVFTGPDKEGRGKLMVRHIDPSNSKNAILRNLELYDITGSAIKHILINPGSNALAYGGYGVYEVPEGSYRMRYLTYTKDHELYPESPGIMIRIKQGYITYLELSGNGEIPFAEIRRPLDDGEQPDPATWRPNGGVKISKANGQGKFWLYNMYGNTGANSTILAELYNDKASFFDSQLADATRLFWDRDKTVLRFGLAKEMRVLGGGRYNTVDLDAGVYWIRVKREDTCTWYSWNTSRWQPIFIFPGTQFNEAFYYYNEGVKTVKYQD